MKGNVLLYKNNILFELNNRYEVSKFSGKYRLLSKELVYIVDNEEVMGVVKEVCLN